MMSTLRWTNSGTRMCSMFASEPVSRLSTQMTRWPRRSSSSQRCDPRKPAPPVTRQVDMGAENTRRCGLHYDRRRRPAGPWPDSATKRSTMAATRFVERLNEQIAYEFAASQQYIANAVYYDAETLPRLAAFFYAQALEERNHAMMMVQYLLDADADVAIPGVAAPETTFADVVAPVALALEQERRVSDEIAALAAIAREEGD